MVMGCTVGTEKREKLILLIILVLVKASGRVQHLR